MQQPNLNPTPFATNGQKNNIPSTANGGSASFQQGFPPLTMTPIDQGGIPPSGQDFNGILNHLDSHIVWQSAGMGYQFDSNFASAIGGYAKGAVVRSNDGLTAYVSTADGNRTDPNTPQSQNWLVFAGIGQRYNVNKVWGDYTVNQWDVINSSIIRVDSGNLATITVPVLPASIGQNVTIRRVNGDVTIIAGNGVTISPSDSSNLRRAGSTATLIYVGDNTWDIYTELGN